MIVEIFKSFLLRIKNNPLEQTLIIATTSYLGFKTVQKFPKEAYFKLNYFGKALSLTSVIGILHFSGLLHEKAFVNRIGIKMFNFGPFECSVSVEKIEETAYNLFKNIFQQ